MHHAHLLLSMKGPKYEIKQRSDCEQQQTQIISTSDRQTDV